ncbi:hypothetical protein [Roseateles sp.]|uniref:hypothetical protein n=1 Tax=Roseateles sp. TaxID=1971397 RepID=UPI0039EA9445
MAENMQQNSMTTHFVSAILSLVETQGMSEEDRKVIREQVMQAVPNITDNPRDKTEPNAQLLVCMAFLLFVRVESLYGSAGPAELHFHPIFWDHPSSRVGPMHGDHDTFGVAIGSFAMTWEDVFYELAHEMVHFLNPVASAHERKVATLDEGVAVKFAENTYREFISGYTSHRPQTSPLTMPDKRYFPAYLATVKIPDQVLAVVRNRFGSFSNINNIEAFGALTSDYLDQSEIALLASPFSYPTPAASRSSTSHHPGDI